MAERLAPISKARAALTRLSRAAQKRLDRYVITQQGQPQSVLLGYEEYRGMQAAVELLQRPQVVANLNAGLRDLENGKRLNPEEMKKRVHEKMREGETRQLAAELADRSGVDLKIVEVVLRRPRTRGCHDLHMTGSSRTLDLIGFALATLRSSLGLHGALMQAKAYYPFKLRKFAVHIDLVFRKALKEGSEAAFNEVRVATALAPGKQEDRAKSLVGL